MKPYYSCMRYLTKTDDVAALNKGPTQDPCEMECAYDPSEPSMTLCEKLHMKRKRRSVAYYKLNHIPCWTNFNFTSVAEYNQSFLWRKSASLNINFYSSQLCIFTYCSLELLRNSRNELFRIFFSSTEPTIEVEWTQSLRKLSSYKFTFLDATNSLFTGHKYNFMLWNNQTEFCSAQ